MEKPFSEIQKNFGFGCMRLPMVNGEVDLPQFSAMVDAFLEAGFHYFDTAHGYLSGKSETAIRAGLTSRYPRERYLLADKLSENFFDSEDEIRPFFENQLRWCGVEYFDFYLLHAQNAVNFEKYRRCRAYETAFALKREGRVRHVGLSFHDKAEVLDRILSLYPELEFVQLQFNYLDVEDPKVQSRLCYEVCRRHGKPVIVMEPVKGGKLVLLPPAGQAVFDALEGHGSAASYALRYAAGFEGVFMVLSGMSNMEQMQDNIAAMRDFRPLSPAEREAVEKVAAIVRGQNLVSCTACRYCVDGCPKRIPIPELFSDLNTHRRFPGWDGAASVRSHTKGRGTAADCIRCGKCEKICPQHLPIRDLLTEVSGTFKL